jgi:hypothetical protein
MMMIGRIKLFRRDSHLQNIKTYFYSNGRNLGDFEQEILTTMMMVLGEEAAIGLLHHQQFPPF